MSMTEAWGRLKQLWRRRGRGAAAANGGDAAVGPNADAAVGRGDDDRGATTAEFAIVTMAAVGFAGLLVVILRSDQVRGILEDLVQRALSVAG